MIFTLWRWWRWPSLARHVFLFYPQGWLWAGCLPFQAGWQPKFDHILCFWDLLERRKFQTFQQKKQKNKTKTRMKSSDSAGKRMKKLTEERRRDSDMQLFPNTQAVLQSSARCEKLSHIRTTWAPFEIFDTVTKTMSLADSCLHPCYKISCRISEQSFQGW